MRNLIKKFLFCGILMAFGASGAAADEIKIKVSGEGLEFQGILADNETSRAFVKLLPLSLDMQNLYGREMVDRLGAGALPVGTDGVRRDNFEAGDLIYRRGSVVILWRQDGDTFERVQLGCLQGDMSVFERIQNAKITISLAE